MDDREHRIKIIEITIAVLGLLGLGFGGVQTYLTYKQHAELQSIRALNDAQLKVCQELVGVAAGTFSAKDSHSVRVAFDEFAKIKHGEGLMLLDKNVLDKAIEVYNKMIDTLAIPDGDDFRAQLRCKLGNSPFELALACRKMMGDAFRKEAGTAIEPIDSSFSVTWRGGCGN